MTAKGSFESWLGSRKQKKGVSRKTGEALIEAWSLGSSVMPAGLFGRELGEGYAGSLCTVSTILPRI